MNLISKAFDLENARACAQASADAYQQSSICDAASDTHCRIIEAPDCFIIAFRGTSSIRNWITDAEFERTILVSGVDGSCSKVHKGFEHALNSVIEKLFAALGGCPAPGHRFCGKPVFVTGHSLGGALAVLAALELERNGFSIAQVYTFGQPRVGNGDFKRRYDLVLGNRTFRLVYQEDIVARIPHLPELFDLYRHVGTEVFISSETPIHSVDDLWFNPPLWRVLVSDLWGIYRAFTIKHFSGALDPIIDHHINNYVGALSQIV